MQSDNREAVAVVVLLFSVYDRADSGSFQYLVMLTVVVFSI